MNKATTKTLDAMPDGATISLTLLRDFYTVAVFNNAVFRQRAPQPLGLAWEIQARTSHKTSVFVLPHYDARLVTFDGDKAPRLYVTIRDSKEPAEAMRPVVDPERVRAAAAAAGVENFSQEDLAEFTETVKRLAQRGIITIPKAQKAVARG